MCGGDDHLAWKHLVSLEACRGLRTAGGYDRFCQGSFNPPILSYRATLTLQVSLDPIKISFLHVGASVNFRSCLGHNWVQLSSSWSPFGVLRDWCMFEFQLGHLFYIVISVSPPFLSFPSCHLSFRAFVPYRRVICFSLDSTSYIRVGDRLIRVSKQSGMDSQHVIVDRLTVTMTLFKRHQQV